jgi:peptidyl-tRNA hydrolase, PTH1 family
VKLVVGLGNPGRKYEGTRHNVGFAVLNLLAERKHAAARKANFQGEITEIELGGQRVLLLWPHTFMNRSGGSVLAARDFYKIANAEIIVVCDDFNLPLGKLRVRTDGSSGGQKGLADTINRLGDDKVPRLRIGVGPVPASWDPADFVLGKFTKDEQTEIEINIQRSADAVETWVNLGITVVMNKFNP